MAHGKKTTFFSGMAIHITAPIRAIGIPQK
jgi:hypothetical protein